MLWPGDPHAHMRKSRTVGERARPAWVTRAEASFLSHVPVEEIDHRIAAGGVAHRRVGSIVLVDLARLTQPVRGAVEPRPVRPPVEPRPVRPPVEPRPVRPPVERRPVRPPVEPRPVRGARARSGRALPGTIVVAVLAGATAIALFVAQLVISRGDVPPVPVDPVASPSAPAVSPAAAIPVGRDPFASPFGAHGKGERSGDVLVKPPGVVRDGDAVIAATTVVNRNDAQWLPPSDVTFVARDATGRVLARTTSTVSLGPGRAQTVIAPDLDVDPAAIAAIEAHIDPAPLRSRGYHQPSVSVTRAAVTDGGKAIAGELSVGPGAGTSAALWCAVFDTLDELAAVSTTQVDLSRSRAPDGRLRFWLTAQPTKPGPYSVSCSARA
jgi:hypothetical protein